MRSGRVLIGHIKGPVGDPARITKVTAEVRDEAPSPICDVSASGDYTDQWLHFVFDGIRGFPAQFINATVDLDNTHSDNPTAVVDLKESENGRGQDVHFDFTGLVGPPAEFVEVTADVVGGDYKEVPTVTPTLEGPAGAQRLHFDFDGLRGEPGAATNFTSVVATMDDVDSDTPECEIRITRLFI